METENLQEMTVEEGKQPTAFLNKIAEFQRTLSDEVGVEPDRGYLFIALDKIGKIGDETELSLLCAMGTTRNTLLKMLTHAMKDDPHLREAMSLAVLKTIYE